MKTSPLSAWNTYPALMFAGVYSGGLVLAHCFQFMTFTVWLFLNAGWFVVFGLFAAFRSFRPRLYVLSPLARTLSILLLLLLLGGARYDYSRLIAPDDVFWHIDPMGKRERVMVEGTVVDTPVYRNGYTSFFLKARFLSYNRQRFNVTGRITVTCFPSNRDQPVFPEVTEGSSLAITGHLEPVPGKRNPLSLDFRSYAARRGFHAALTAESSGITRLPGQSSEGSRLKLAIRRYAGRQLDRYVAFPESRDVLLALIVGDRSRVDEETLLDFRQTGLLHLLAISGMHILVIGMALYGLLRPLLCRLRLSWFPVEIIRTISTTGILLVYMVVTGSTPSVVRAVVMAIVLMGGNLVQRPHRTLNSLGVAALILLLFDPLTLFDAGFLLSFAAVAAIVVIHPLLMVWTGASGLTNTILKAVCTAFSVSVAALLGTAPVLLAFFGRVSFAGLVLNLPAIPLTSMAMISGVGVIVFGGWADVLATAYGSAANGTILLLLEITRRGNTLLSGWAINSRPSDIYVVPVITGLLFTLAWWPAARWRWRGLICCVFLITIGVFRPVMKHHRTLDVLFFDVGQGDAALISLPDGSHVLIDSGPASPISDAGRRVIAPYLKAACIDHLDAVVLSHADTDHSGGLVSVLRTISTRRLILNTTNRSEPELKELFSVADSLRLEIHSLHAPDTLFVEKNVRIMALSPPPGMNWDKNDRSIVLFVQYGVTAFLFMGDAGKTAEYEMIRRFGKSIKSRVVKVGHHGSASSSSSEWIQTILPDSIKNATAVFSAGRNNRYGLPHPDVVRHWRSTGADLRFTATQGAVWLRSDGRDLAYVDWK